MCIHKSEIGQPPASTSVDALLQGVRLAHSELEESLKQERDARRPVAKYPAVHQNGSSCTFEQHDTGDRSDLAAMDELVRRIRRLGGKERLG